MSPIEISEIEQRLGAGLDQRAGQVTVPSSDEGRAAIVRRVTQRRHHRRVVQTTGAVLVVLAIVAVGFGVTRGRDDGQKVVSGPNIDVPPLPQLAVPASVGTSHVSFLWPGTQEIIDVYRGNDGPRRLDIVLSDLSLDELQRAKVGLGRVVVPATVKGQPAFGLYDDPNQPQEPEVFTSGLYWKPDAHHIAALELVGTPDSRGVQKTAALADQLVTVGDQDWWDAIATGTNSRTYRSSATAPSEPAATLANPAVRLGLPGGRTTPLLFQVGVSRDSALDVEGYPAGTFALRTYLTPGVPRGLLKPTDPGAVSIRGRTGVYQDADQGGGRARIRWIEDGIMLEVNFAPVDGGRAPTTAAAIHVADQLKSLSMSTWRSLLLPSTVRTDVVTLPAPGHTPCLTGACPLSPFSDPSTTTTGG